MSVENQPEIQANRAEPKAHTAHSPQGICGFCGNIIIHISRFLTYSHMIIYKPEPFSTVFSTAIPQRKENRGTRAVFPQTDKKRADCKSRQQSKKSYMPEKSRPRRMESQIFKIAESTVHGISRMSAKGEPQNTVVSAGARSAAEAALHVSRHGPDASAGCALRAQSTSQGEADGNCVAACGHQPPASSK